MEFLFASIFILMSGGMSASLASFIGVLAERPQRGESILGRSHCACGRPLKVYENIPVFGWLRVAGKTKCCKSRIPSRYVISEAIAFIPGAVAGYFLYTTLSDPLAESLPWFVLSVGGVAFTLAVELIVMHSLARKDMD